MSQYKNNNISPGAGHQMSAVRATGGNPGKPGYESTLRKGRLHEGGSPQAADLGGWDSYRRWLNRVQGQDRRRSIVDPALYTWKGYRSWSEKIRRDWKQDE